MVKNIFKYVSVLAFAMAITTGCEAPDQEIFDQIAREEGLNTTDPEALAAFAASAYSPLTGNWGGHNSLWSLQEISSDEMVIPQRGPDWEDGLQWIRVHQHNYLPSEQSINNGWTYCYGVIANVNNLLKDFGENEILRSEFEVLRALAYLWLIDAYGNVPIITEESTDATPPNNTRQEVYSFIETSVLENLDNLRKEKTYATINYYVAQAILAKLYLNAQVYTGSAQWQKCVDACDEIIESGLYSLEADFFNNFSTNNATSVENIFVVNYDENNAQGFNLPQMTLHYASQATFKLQQQPWNGYATLEEFYNSFEDGDDRKNSFIVGPQYSAAGERLVDLNAEADDPDGQPLTFTPALKQLYPGARRQDGARVGKFEFRIGATPNLSNDYPIFRYGDVLLMKAESLWRLNAASVEALELVNQVRARSNPTPLAVLTADNLLAERGREMFAEAYRRQDLIRFGRYDDAWWEKPASAPTKALFPIPQAQLQSNPDLDQNDGY
ncbi:MAG TPA: RagB/SusD family nutrient uptake outer membrane protein [Chryseosolibacter sp.]|nr:RagB/SusD family nutrient uptake outer membrane protein [Chryseosolibacter sp.]